MAGQVHHAVHALRRDRPHLGGQVAGVVDGVRRAQVADEVGLGARLGGGDDLGAMGDGELDRVGADATGRAGHQHSLAGGGGQGVDGVQRGGATLPISSMTTAVKSSRSVRLVLPASTCARIPKFNVRTTRHVLKIGGNSLLDEHERSAHFPLLGRPAVAGSGADGHPRRATDLLGGAAATYPTQPASWRFTRVRRRPTSPAAFGPCPTEHPSAPPFLARVPRLLPHGTRTRRGPRSRGNRAVPALRTLAPELVPGAFSTPGADSSKTRDVILSSLRRSRRWVAAVPS